MQNTVPNDDGKALYINKGDTKYWDRLEQLNLVGEIPQHKAMILARLLGAIDSDGHLGIRKDNPNSVRCLFHLGEYEDYEELCHDCSILGVKIPSFRKSGSSLCVEVEVALGILMLHLGACPGNKVKSTRQFPAWIKDSSSVVKREFLSGYHGGDGSKVAVNIPTTQQQVCVKSLPCRSMKDDEIRMSHIKYLNEIISLYKEFNIECSLQEYACKESEKDRTDFKIYFNRDYDNTERIVDTINYRYCNHKKRESKLAIEFLKTRMRGIRFPYDKFQECFSYHTENTVYATTFIESIEEIPTEPVYDFTTISDNHSFIANNFISHNCMPSRMTINQLMEMTLGKACCATGIYGDCTPFGENSVNVAPKICEALKKNGFQAMGKETLLDGMSGELIEAEIYTGPTYYQRLKHMVGDKIHARARGNVTMLTRQPLEGRSRDGGLRYGEINRSQWYGNILLVCVVAGNIAKLRENLVGLQYQVYVEMHIWLLLITEGMVKNWRIETIRSG